MRIDKKKEIVKELHEKFLRSKVVIVTDYKGLDVTTINDLRRKLGAEKIEYKVVKNSLLIRASEETDIALIKDYFKGPSAVALSYDDPVAPAKVLTTTKNKTLNNFMDSSSITSVDWPVSNILYHCYKLIFCR